MTSQTWLLPLLLHLRTQVSMGDQLSLPSLVAHPRSANFQHSQPLLQRLTLE